MKIECDKCAAKYSIADEKVRGKTFKIRCKKCSNVIIVRDKAAAAGADAEPDAGEEDQGAPGWHLAINGETLGPIAEEDVRDRYTAGEIDKDTAVWQEGFEDWIPLGDVPVFADLPDQPTGGGGYADDGGEDDPFASANQEDYAAGGGAGLAASAAVAAASHQPAAQSPRVSNLTGQRNENSVLFSLDSLQALATAPAQAAKPTAGTNQQVGTKGLATAAPGSEGSGLIDIRALGAMVGSEQQPMAAASAPAVDDAALPSFGGSGLGGLAAAPLVAAPSPEPAAAAAAAAPPPPVRSNAPIYVLMVLLILALGGLAAYILLKPEKEPQVIVKEVPGAAPSVGDKADDKDEDEDEDKKKDEDEDEKDEKDSSDEDEKDSSDEDEKDSADGDATPANTKSGSSSRGKKKKKSTSKPSGSSDPMADIGKSKPTPAPKPSGKSSDVSVDCILDPAACGRGKKKKSSSAPAASSDPNLPQKLGSSDIKAGVAPVKGAAKSCGGKHGASPGTRVKVRLSILGASGTVGSATAEAPHKGTPLGNCVAAALKKAKFKKFKSTSMGAVYPISL